MNSRHTWHGDVAGLAGVSKNNGLSLIPLSKLKVSVCFCSSRAKKGPFTSNC